MEVNQGLNILKKEMIKHVDLARRLKLKKDCLNKQIPVRENHKTEKHN